MPTLGTSRGYRPRPRGFRDTFVRVGWDLIEEECRANKRAVFRWIREENADLIREAATAGGMVLLLEDLRAIVTGRPVRRWLNARNRRRQYHPSPDRAAC